MVRSGGKRLRPAFCHWGFVGAGGDPDDERVVDAGAAFELMHAFALFHDDVMDDSASRRGAPTTHAVYADEHGEATWAGESRRFGEGVAILVGDLAFVLADELLIGAPPEVWALWNELRIELNVGQYLDILGSVQRRAAARQGRADRPLQERQVHDRAPAARRRRARRARAPGRAAARAEPLRPAARRRLPDARRRHRRVRRHGGHRQAGRRRPARGQADAAAGAGGGARRRRAATPARRGSASPRLDDDEVAAIQEVIVDTGALDALEARIAELAAEAVAALDDVDISAGGARRAGRAGRLRRRPGRL